MLGDFNIVEDSLDCLPCHADPLGPVSKLDCLKAKLLLEDGGKLSQQKENSPTCNLAQEASLE